jgi:CheY-like chemotaxis protein
MPDGGLLTIEAANKILDETYVEQNPEVTPGPYVQFAVTDTGTGMSAELIERVLEPFFTTKPVGAGSGLGLSMVYGFVKQSGGHLKIYSEVGRGTTIRLYLPKARGDEDEFGLEHETKIIPVSTGNEVILVLEDDAMVRKLTVRVLKGLGYRTLEAGDAPAAETILRAPGQIDLLFTDVVLPKGISGPELARRGLRERPGLKVLYMSGYTGDAIGRNGLLEEGVHLLSKPFPRAELARMVRNVLDDESSA